MTALVPGLRLRSIAVMRSTGSNVKALPSLGKSGSTPDLDVLRSDKLARGYVICIRLVAGRRCF